jgi:hypothetical protein
MYFMTIITAGKHLVISIIHLDPTQARPPDDPDPITRPPPTSNPSLVLHRTMETLCSYFSRRHLLPDDIRMLLRRLEFPLFPRCVLVLCQKVSGGLLLGGFGDGEDGGEGADEADGDDAPVGDESDEGER